MITYTQEFCNIFIYFYCYEYIVLIFLYILYVMQTRIRDIAQIYFYFFTFFTNSFCEISPKKITLLSNFADVSLLYAYRILKIFLFTYRVLYIITNRCNHFHLFIKFEKNSDKSITTKTRQHLAIDKDIKM